MITIRGTIRQGQVVLPEAARWPDGTEVLVQLPDPESSPRKDDDYMSPEEIARILALLDQIEPVELSEQERAEWQRRREAQKSADKESFFERGENLRRILE